MEVIVIDSARVAESDDVASVHSLRDLVSSDDSIYSLERHNDERSIDESPSLRNCECHLHRRVSRVSGTEISIIACSSPEITALVHPIPSSIQCQHQRSVSTLELFPEARNDDECYGSYIYPATQMKDNTFPVVSPTTSPDHGHLNVNGKIKVDDLEPLLIEHRDEECDHSEDRHICTKKSTPTSRNSLYSDETDELALCLERQRIGSSRFPNEEVRDSPHLSNVPISTITIPEKYPMKKKRWGHEEKSSIPRSSMHRRISYDSLPEISEILFQSDFLSPTAA